MYGILDVRLLHSSIAHLNHYYMRLQCRTQGGPEGHVPRPKRPKRQKKTFHVLLKEKVGEGGTDRAVTPASK